MAKETKNQAKFSIPFRAGMEQEPGYVKTAESSAKSYPGETNFAYFVFSTDGITVDDDKALAAGRLALARAKVVKDNMSVLKVKYSLGGITNEDKAYLKGVLDITDDISIIMAALQKSGRAVLAGMSQEQIQDLLDSLEEEDDDPEANGGS